MLKLGRRLRYLLRLRSLEKELQEELEFHRAERQRQLETSGMASGDAATASRRALGNMTLVARVHLPIPESRDWRRQEWETFAEIARRIEVAIVNASFAYRFFPGEDAIGKRFKEGGPERKDAWITIVGIVGDMHRHGLETGPVPEFFFPSSEPTMDVVIRTSTDPALLGPAVREAIKSTYAGAILLKVETVEDMFGDLNAQRRLQTWLMTAFALAALVLSVVGIYGVLHFAVAQRRREFGVRIALGASRADLFRLVIGEGMRLPALGVGLGLIGALAVMRVIDHLLFQVSPTDPTTFVSVAMLLMAVSFMACWIPARRATRIDPIAALRCE